MNTIPLSEAGEPDAAREAWQVALIGLGAGLVVLFAVYWQTFYSMAHIWWRSETFAHGFLIFPISLFLIWRRRRRLLQLAPRPNLHGLWMLGGLGLGWLAAQVVDVQVVQQMIFIAMVVVLTFTLLGWQVTREIAFPLAFLFFAVPFGEFLIPPLMNFTADFTVAMIELTGIPVYREGTFFSIPSGDWSVVEGCSGLRYLIASITVGCLYAYLTYRSLWRRLAFIALSMSFPVIANGLRAFMIVMIAHYSDMKLALGVDHYIYGWVFFGLVMMLMFWIGSFWREDEDSEASDRPAGEPVAGKEKFHSGAVALAAVSAVIVLSIWPIRAAQIRDRAAARTAPVVLELPERAGAWRRVEAALTDWQPRYLYPDATASAVYSDGGRRVRLTVLYYRLQEQGKELVNSQNVLVRQKHPVWKMPWEEPVAVELASGPLKVREGLLQSPRQQLLVWRWNWISGHYLINDHAAKLLEARDKLLGTPRDAAAIVIAAEFNEMPGKARAALHDFTGAMLPRITQILKRAGEGIE